MILYGFFGFVIFLPNFCNLSHFWSICITFVGVAVADPDLQMGGGGGGGGGAVMQTLR